MLKMLKWFVVLSHLFLISPSCFAEIIHEVVSTPFQALSAASWVVAMPIASVTGSTASTGKIRQTSYQRSTYMSLSELKERDRQSLSLDNKTKDQVDNALKHF